MPFVTLFAISTFVALVSLLLFVFSPAGLGFLALGCDKELFNPYGADDLLELTSSFSEWSPSAGRFFWHLTGIFRYPFKLWVSLTVTWSKFSSKVRSFLASFRKNFLSKESPLLVPWWKIVSFFSALWRVVLRLDLWLRTMFVEVDPNQVQKDELKASAEASVLLSGAGSPTHYPPSESMQSRRQAMSPTPTEVKVLDPVPSTVTEISFGIGRVYAFINDYTVVVQGKSLVIPAGQECTVYGTGPRNVSCRRKPGGDALQVKVGPPFGNWWIDEKHLRLVDG
jgi:hypothetical protein